VRSFTYRPRLMVDLSVVLRARMLV
jgi:hypothetical protein